MNITDDSSETYRKKAMLTARPRKLPEVTFSRHNRNISDAGPVKMTNKQLSQVILSNQTDFIDSHTYENRKLDTQSGSLSDTLQNNQCKAEHLSKSISISLNHVTNEPNVNDYTAPNTTRTDAVTSEPVAASCDAPSIGQDLWRQLKRVQIPSFAGDKRMYQSWKAAFTACIVSALATGEYKLLQLRQYLTGEALKAIENLGHSAFAHEAAKERLERKYGGETPTNCHLLRRT